MGKPERTGRPRRRWVNNIKMYLGGIGWVGMDWIELDQDRDHRRALVNTIRNFLFPQNVRKFLCSCTIGGFSRSVMRARCPAHFIFTDLIVLMISGEESAV
jgi:hypothetical protein